MKPASFCAFVAALGVRLTPGQRVLAAVAFDGAQPRDLDEADREIARALFGAVGEVHLGARGVLALVKGARIGGSYLFGALRLLHLALTVPLNTLAPGEVAAGIIVAPDLRLARQCLRYALGAARSAPSIASLVSADGADSFTLRREGGRSVVIECLPATRGGSAVRGRSLVGAALEECAFFRDDSAVVNDVEVFRGIAPRIMAGGQIVASSTPWAESGLLFDLFTANHGKPAGALAALAPTLLMRPDARTRALVERERERDPDNAAREFDAEFMAVGSGAFFDASAIDRAVESAPFPVALEPGDRAFVGVDLAFVSDASALAVVLLRGGRYIVAELAELRPTRGAPLVPSAVVAHFAEIAKRYGASTIVSDVHYQESAREYVSAAGLALAGAPGAAVGKTLVHLKARELLHCGSVALPAHARLLSQLKAIVSKPTTGGSLAISTPRRAGAGHGDIASAFVLALWQAASEAEAPHIRPPREFTSRWAGMGSRGFG